MAFHKEWTWYKIYYPNPDAAICRLGMDDAEWQRSTRRKDAPWFKDKDLETSYTLLNNRKNIMPDAIAYKSLLDQQQPQQSNLYPRFSYELFYRMLQERDELVKRGLLPPEKPDPFPPCFNQQQNNWR